ncbi:MAG: VanZ family protein [Gemmatimonadota bacterium]|nr:MAG: VanZ family protein [Gemmatimonadota bacterium]
MRSDISGRIGLASRVAYCGVIAVATLASLQFDPDIGRALARLPETFTPSLTPRDLVDAIRNLALFAGWGALWVVTTRLRQLKILLLRVVLSGFLLSLAVETAQLFSPIRQTSILDLFNNTVGALAGALLVVMMVEVAVRLRNRKSYFGVPAITISGAYLCAALFQAAVLTRPQPAVGVYGGPIARFREMMARLEWGSLTELSLLDAFLFIPVGVLVVVTLAESGWTHKRAARLAVAIGVILSLAAELIRAPLGLELSLGAVIMHTVGATIGAVVTAKWLPEFSRQVRGRHRPLALALAYVVVLAAWSWQPFLLETDMQAILEQLSLTRFSLLSAHIGRVDVYSVADIGAAFFLFLPVGALLAVWPLKRRGWLADLLPGLYLAALAELSQILIVDRYFSLTDAIVQCAGVAIGWMVVRMAGYQPHGVLLPRRAKRGGKPAA